TVYLFATRAMSAFLVSRPYIAAPYFFEGNSSPRFGLRLVLVVAYVFLPFGIVASVAALSAPVILVGANVILRLFANNGVLMAKYQSFFVDHPRTYYSSVTGINRVVPYPFAHPLGVEISLAAGGDETYNQNAGLWATDGIA